jgi:hypothetical protein
VGLTVRNLANGYQAALTGGCLTQSTPAALPLHSTVRLCLTVAQKKKRIDPGRSRFAQEINDCLSLGGPGSQLHPVLFFLQKLNRHHSILFEPAIKLAAIDSERCGSLNLIAAKLLQDR